MFDVLHQRSLVHDGASGKVHGSWSSRVGLSLAIRTSRKHLLLGLAFGVATIAAMARAEDNQPVKTSAAIAFHIPAQPLASALQAFGQQTGVQVLYESNSALGLESAAVEGQLPPDAALTQLLRGTDLQVRYVRPDVITLALPSFEKDSPPSSPLATADLSLGTLRVRNAGEGDDLARLRDYNEVVQTDIQSALRKNSRTRSGSYRAVLDLWVDPSRTIRRTELSQSTGDTARDAAVMDVLQGVVISRPAPANAPQPVRIVIVVRR